MHKILAFFRRDFLVLISYRLRLVLDLGYLAVIAVFLFFVGRTFQGGFSTYLERYGNDYFAFALLGMAVSVFVSTGLSSLSEAIRSAQVEGTLESLLMTPTSPLLILFGSSLWSFVESFLQSLVYLAAASFILGLALTPARLAATLAVLFLTFACFLSIGMISAAFIMVFKQGNPINAVFGVSSYFLGGLLFPTEVLPAPLEFAASFLPMTRAATAVREILLVAPERSEWIPAALYLAAFALVFLPIGMASLKYALARAKRDGSLVQF